MPTDGADFGRMKACYGKAYTATAAFGEPFEVINPFAFLTKSQMLTGSGMRPFEDLLQKSFSCERYPNYPHKASQCGTCPSCLIRRLAFYSAEMPDDGKTYSADILSLSRSLRGREWLGLTKLTLQAEALGKALRTKEPWPGLCSRWPSLLRTETELSDSGFRDRTISLLRRHVSEWETFSSVVWSRSTVLAA